MNKENRIKRKEKILELRSQGKNYREIAAITKLSRQGVGNILNNLVSDRERRGRPPDIEAIKKAQKLRAKGVGYWDIARACKRKDVKTIWRWLKYDLGKNT